MVPCMAKCGPDETKHALYVDRSGKTAQMWGQKGQHGTRTEKPRMHSDRCQNVENVWAKNE